MKRLTMEDIRSGAVTEEIVKKGMLAMLDEEIMTKIDSRVRELATDEMSIWFMDKDRSTMMTTLSICAGMAGTSADIAATSMRTFTKFVEKRGKQKQVGANHYIPLLTLIFIVITAYMTNDDRDKLDQMLDAVTKALGKLVLDHGR